MAKKLKKFKEGGTTETPKKPLVNWFDRTKEFEYEPVLNNKGEEVIDRKTKKPLLKTTETVTAPESILSKGFEKKIVTTDKRKNAKYLNIPNSILQNADDLYIEGSNENQEIYVNPNDRKSLKSNSIEIGKEIIPKRKDGIYLNPNLKYIDRTFDSGGDRTLVAGLNAGLYKKYKNFFGTAGAELAVGAVSNTAKNPKPMEKATNNILGYGISPNVSAGYNYSNKRGLEGSVKANIGLDKREIEAKQNLGIIGLRAAIGQNQNFLGDIWGGSSENSKPYTKIGANILLDNIKRNYDNSHQEKIVKTRTVDKKYNEDNNRIKLRNPRTLANGGTIDEEAGKRGMMKARMALDAHFGNPSAQRMVSPNPKTGMTPEGIGTHYMASMDNYAVPLLQDKGGNYLQYNSNPAPSSEDMRFESPENAKYFAENYKNIAPMMRSNKFAGGGTSSERVPIVVNNPNDPRLRAYNDSNSLYNFSNQERVNNIIKQGFAYDTKNNKIKNNIFSEKDKAEYQKISGVNSKKGLQKIVQSGNNGIRDNAYNGEMDTKAQYELMHGKIAPVASANTYDKQWRKNKYLYETESGYTFGGSEYDKNEKGFRKNPNYGKPFPKDKNGTVIRNFFEIPIYKQPVQPYVYEKAKPVIKQNIPQSIANQTSDFQPDMVQTNNTPNYDKTKLYQGYDFMQQTGLRPGDYTETQVQEAMKNKSIPKKSLGGRVLPKFYDGGGVRLTGSSTFNSAMKAPAGTVTKTASGKAPSNFGDNVVTGAGIAGAAVPMLTSFIPDDRITDSEGNEIGSKQSLGKGVLNGAAQGASMGAAAGPWGVAIGAGVGAIYGGVTNSMNNADVDRAQRQANMRIQNRNISNSVLTNKNMFSTNVNNNDQMIAANGGTVIDEDMGNPNAELELNETFRDPMTGEVGMVDGPSHDNGGIEMSLAEGTQIWSDRLKHNGRTFASLTKPIINKIANIEKGLDTNPNSRFKQNSIKLLNSQLDFFFNVQESNKQQDEMKRTLKKQEGGVVDDMGNYHYANGGIYIKPENRGKFTAYKERTGKTTEEALHSPNAHVRQMANFAKNAAGWKHAEGGYVLPKFAGAGTFGDPETEPVVPEEVPYVNDFNAKSRRDFLLKNNPTQFANSLKQARLEGNNQAMYGNSWNNKGYTLGANGAAGDQYTFDKIGKPTYQETEAQPENKSQWYRRNNGELMQASALAGSTFAQLNNINRQAAPGIRPDVRLTGAIPNPKYVDLSAERGAINRSALGAMGNRDFGNSATAQAFKNKARINQLEGLGKSFSNQEIANADIGNKFAGMRGDAAMKEAMMNNEIANTNLENKYQFNQNRMANQNAAIGTLGHGFGDIGRNRTNQFNEMERLGSISNRYDKSAYASSIRDNPERLKQGIDAGMYTIDELQKWGIPYTPQAKYGGTFKKGTIKNRSLKY